MDNFNSKPQFRRSYILIPTIVALAFALGLLGGALFFGQRGNGGVSQKINDIMRYIQTQYVDEVNTDSLLESSISDIMAKLDPHSVYIPASELQATNEELDGSFSGIGIQFNMLTDTVTVLEVISGGPSEKVGIMPGDRIVTINDTVAAGQKWSNDQIISRLRGAKGSKVKLGVKRDTSSKLLTFEVTRGDIPVTSIDASYMINPTTGYIKVNKFGRTTYDEFLTSLSMLGEEGAKDYIIDLRGNTGGFMEMAILMANEFLQAGQPIVSTHGRTSDSESSTAADGNGSFKDANLTVLIDEFSASASEIFAGAIQDNDRGLVIGRRSFGKGLVQRQIDLRDNSAIRLTTGRYYTPSGRCVQKTYAMGDKDNYSHELIDRFSHGEAFNADSIKFDKSQQFSTATGRIVYGGGGIMPDIFVPNDTTGITTYYLNVINAGLLHKFAFNYVDTHRNQLNKAKTVEQLVKMLPSDDVLIQTFADYAYTQGGVAPRWYYINISRDLIVNQLKGLIARDVLGQWGYYKVTNELDTTVQRALDEMAAGHASVPVTIRYTSNNIK